MPGWYTGSAMTPQVGGGLDFPILLALMLVALLLRSALGTPLVRFDASCRGLGTWWGRPGIVLGLILGVGAGLLLVLTVLSLR